MRRGVVMIWLALCCWVQVVPADARVGMYFVKGDRHDSLEKESMSDIRMRNPRPPGTCLASCMTP